MKESFRSDRIRENFVSRLFALRRWPIAVQDGLTVRHPLTVRNHANVLQHMAGYVSVHLDPPDRSELTELIDRYRRLVRLILPETLLRHYVRKYEVSYLADQVYLDLHPDGLMRVNHL